MVECLLEGACALALQEQGVADPLSTSSVCYRHLRAKYSHSNWDFWQGEVASLLEHCPNMGLYQVPKLYLLKISHRVYTRRKEKHLMLLKG